MKKFLICYEDSMQPVAMYESEKINHEAYICEDRKLIHLELPEDGYKSDQEFIVKDELIIYDKSE